MMQPLFLSFFKDFDHLINILGSSWLHLSKYLLLLLFREFLRKLYLQVECLYDMLMIA